MQVEFRVLGPVEVRDGGVDRTPGSAQQRRLLAVLLVQHGEVVSTGRLLDALWGDQPPATSLKTFRTYLSRLRSALEVRDAGGKQPAIVTRRPGYQLVVPPEQVDAYRFGQLVEQARRRMAEDPLAALAALDRALGFWRGAAFGEFAHEEFARAEAARLEELLLAATEERFEALLGTGAYATVAAEAAAFARAHPLRERVRGQLMRALYRDGRQPEALAAYQQFRDLLNEEIGVEPSPALRELQRDILRQRGGLSRPEPDRPADMGGLGSQRPPRFRTRFVGRDDDRAGLLAALAAGHLVTVLGVGGVGKTRLVAELVAGGELREHGRIWWCDLAEVGTGDAVPAGLAAALGALGRPGGSATDAVVAHLAATPAVLVLDNCEHVLAGVAPVIEAVLQRCGQTRVVATSRVRLGLDGERIYQLVPLPVPEPAHADLRSPAVALFADRASAVRPGLHLEREQATAVAALCRRLDGLPLSIELAAARLSGLNLADLGERLDDRFRLLASPYPTTTERHRTLAALVDWSYHLLSGVERRLFERVSVFAGGFTAAAAEAVCAGAGVAVDEVLPLLGQLVDASMVSVGPAGGHARYHLLETLREYGDQRLRERGDARRWEDAHTDYFLGLSEQADRRLAGPQEADAVGELDAELGNLRAVHRRATAAGLAEVALRLSTLLWRYAVWRLHDEVFRWAEQAVAMFGAEREPGYVPACGVAAWGAALRGERDAAQQLAAQAMSGLPAGDPRALRAREVRMHLALWEGRLDDCLAECAWAAACTDEPAEFFPHTVRILALAYAGRADAALAEAAALQPVAERLGNPSMRSMLAYARAEAMSQRDPHQAIEWCERSRDLAVRVRNRMMLGVASVTLASLQARHGDSEAALRSFRQVIDHLYEGSDWTHLWTGLRSLAELLARMGQAERAAVLHGAVTQATTAPPVYGDDAVRLRRVAGTLRHALGESVFVAAQEQGRAMDDPAAVSYALASIDRAIAAGGRAPHTGRPHPNPLRTTNP